MSDRPRVLLVEDDDAVVKLLRRSLSRQRLVFDHARDGQEAILVTQNHLPALVVMDVMMPHLDGFEATRYLKRRYPGYLPVLILTALDDPDSLERARAVDADYYVTKPIDHADLRAATRLLVDLSAAEARLAAGEADATPTVVEARAALCERLRARGLDALAELHRARLRTLAPEHRLAKPEGPAETTE
jgi:CheY-like chemotaxis protein